MMSKTYYFLFLFSIVALNQACKFQQITDLSNNKEQAVSVPSDTAAFNQHEPKGFRKLGERGFSRYEEGWFEQGNGNLAILHDKTAPRSPRSIARIRYPVGFRGGYEPAKTGFWDFKTKEIYVSMSVRVSESWQSHPSGVNKILFITDESYGGGGDPMYFLMNGQGENYFMQIRKQGPSSSINYEQNVGKVNVYPGEWYNVEMLLVMNSAPDKHDGEAHLWVNGVKTSEHDDIRWSTGARIWDSFRWEPIWGGVHGNVGQAMHMDMDHIYVSGK